MAAKIIAPKNWLPPAIQNSSGAGQGFNYLDRHPNAREYAPGGSKRFSDSRVSALNHELQSISADGKETLFAAWHEEKDALWHSKLMGVVIWSTNAVNEGVAHPIGNPTITKGATAGYKVGQADTKAIMEMVSNMKASLSASTAKAAWDLREEYHKRLNKPIEDASKAADDAAKYATQEEILSEVFANKPTRSDRTVSQAATLGHVVNDRRSTPEDPPEPAAFSVGLDAVVVAPDVVAEPEVPATPPPAPKDEPPAKTYGRESAAKPFKKSR